MLQNWGSLDPSAARAWLERLDPSKQKPDVYTAFVKGWLEADRKSALDYLIANASTEILFEAISKTALALFTESKDSARSFVMELAVEKARDAAVDEIIAYATDRVIGSTLSLPTDEVAQWLLTLPAEVCDEHIGWVLSNWHEKDANTFARWLGGLPLETRERVTARYCLAWRYDEVQRSIETGLSIRDPALRWNTVRQLIKEIQSSEAARENLQRVGLSRKQAAELARIVQEQ